MPVLTVVKVLLAMYVYGIEGVCVWVEVSLALTSLNNLARAWGIWESNSYQVPVGGLK